MGSGIAQLCAQKEFEVFLSEKDENSLEKGVSTIRTALSKMVAEQKINDAEKSDIFGRIHCAVAYDHLATCDLIIEAVTEDLNLKKNIFRELDRFCPEKTILASNTSVLPITELAKVTSRRHRILGTHFLTPPAVIPLLEIIRTPETDGTLVNDVVKFGRHLGKQVVLVNDSPGFIVNRILTPILLNAVRLLEEGVATKEDIEIAARFGLGFPMSPFKLLDLIGLDTISLGTDVLSKALDDRHYQCPKTIKEMVRSGLLGRKTGEGFFQYSETENKKGDNDGI